MPTPTTRFAGYPSAIVFANSDGTKAVQHLLWGDWLRLKSGRNGDYRAVRARGIDGWMHKDDIQTDRLLEVVFVDIGQGDGCLLVTPQDEHFVIDAGVGDNMARFLRWRYGGFKTPWKFKGAVISHPDTDHYRGFSKVFDYKNVTFSTIYHNGIVERTGSMSLGKTKKIGKRKYLQELVRNETELAELLKVKSRRGQKVYPNMLHDAQVDKKFKYFRMLSSLDEFMPGYGPDKELNIEVLGPVPEGTSEEPLLRWFGSKGKTKNGHSVVLKLTYRDVSMLLGGDLNIPAEEHLLRHHTGHEVPPDTIEDHESLIGAARNVFQVDIAKSCHHGSSDFSSLFLAALNPLATVISSGDNEPYSHPRADTLGATGALSRGARPLIFSTELARSAPELIKHPFILRRELKSLQAQIDIAEDGSTKEKQLKKKFDKLVDKIDRSVAVFGAIHVRTDGRRVVMAQKIEKPRGKGRKWDIYRLESKGSGPLQYISKY